MIFEKDDEKYWFDPLAREHNYDRNIEPISVRFLTRLRIL